jgi:cytoskeletal protein CcmA (bactofilin family)
VTWALALLLSGVVLAPAGATERIAGQNPTVPPAQTIADDVLMAGNTLLMQGTVEGDLAAAGANVTVSGNVSGDVMAAGANVTVSAPVGDDLRAAGANVTVSGPVRDNALLAGSAIVLQPGGRIGRDADIAGGSIQVQGKVGRNLSLSGADVQLAAEVGGTVRAQVDRLRLLPGATVRGDLIVYGPRAPEISPGARVLGRVDHRVTRPAAGARAPQRGVGWLMGWLFHFFWLFVVGATGVALSHAWPDRVADVLTRRLGPAALTGFLSLVAVPVVVLVLMFTLIGIPLAVIALALFVVGTILAAPFVAFCIGRWLLTRLGRALASPYTEVAVGALVSSFLMVLPGIGWLFWLLFLVVGFGALLLERWDRRLWTGGERNGGDLAAAR